MTPTGSGSPGGGPRIAVDLLGGDDAPAVVVDGALLALAADPDIALLLVGPDSVIDGLDRALDPAIRARVELRAAASGVAMTDPVTRGADPSTSIGTAIRELAEARVDAVVSAGATGAIVAAAVLGLKRQAGVRRPALAALLPRRHQPLVLLDVGAGMQVDPVELITHGLLGAAYGRTIAGLVEPRVGLMSVGHEAGKGDQPRRMADAGFRVRPLTDAIYVGPVEGHDVVLGRRADVIVTDGFTGNVLLKAVEAALSTAKEYVETWAQRATIPRAAALLGVSGTVVVCHGAAVPADIASGIELAVRLVRAGVTGQTPIPDRDLANATARARLAEVPT